MITKEFLKEHFHKHDAITLYKPDGTPVTFVKYHNIVMHGGYHQFTFESSAHMADACNQRHFSTHPIISID